MNRNPFRLELRAMARVYGSLRRGECSWNSRIRSSLGPCRTVRGSDYWRNDLQWQRNIEARGA